MPLKRYIGRFRKPGGWRRVRNALRYIVLPAVVAVALMVVVRAFVLSHYVLGADRTDLGLVAGDRLLVVRPTFDFGHTTARGDVIAYHPSDTSRTILIDRVSAVSGDRLHARRLGQDSLAVGRAVISGSNVVGRATCISYSVIPGAPVYACLRSGRFFLLISN